ncbi:LamG-like jellyroll fold domain-containing protein [Saltatorellus ferox]|uniref:LamG-like jellyroll fold domain-containing protein n=1 Tax=Saltatorellus ferox TaxID=2528018 RepID=UPI003AF3D91F
MEPPGGGGVYDGSEVRLYLNGQQIASQTGSGKRTRNELDLIVGGDITRTNGSDSTLDGDLDEVRLSKGARYVGESFRPARRFQADDDTILLLHMDAAFGPYLRGGRTLGAILERAGRLGDL